MAAKAKEIARSPVLSRLRNIRFWGYQKRGIVCPDWLRKHYNVPKNAAKLELVAYDTPIRNYTMSITLRNGKRYAETLEGGDPVVVHPARLLIMRRIGFDRTFHLGVEYE